jgi:LacI family transcriptional regulator
MAATIVDVAKAAGVSITTASRVFTNSDHAVNQETRERILSAAKSLGYEPNLLASGLRRGHSNTIGIILDNIVSDFTPTIVRGLQDHLKQFGYSSLIVNSDYDRAAENESVRFLLSRQVDGIIFVDTNAHSVDQIIPRTHKPLVFVKRRTASRSKKCVSVLPDNRYGGWLATHHLIQAGHRRIAHIQGPDGWDASILREEGYREALQQAGLPIDETCIARGDWEKQTGYNAMQKLLDLPSPPTAVFAANDAMAVGAIYAIQDRGLSVPGHIAVIGFDDVSFAKFVRPTLTTIRQPLNELGVAAARAVLDQLAGKTIEEMTIEVKGKLIVRESCGSEQK